MEWKVSILSQTIHHTAAPNVGNKSVGWDDFLTSLFQIIIGVKMIEIERNYKITLTEEQARLLYHILDMTDNDRRRELNGLYTELKDTLKIGIR